jgi:hypothetical protein
MPLKKRSSVPTADEAVPERLHIVAQEKKPLPEGSRIASVVGDNPIPSEVRRVGSVAKEISSPPDELFTLQDRVTAMQTPFDPKNTSEVRYRNRVTNRAKGITAMCVTCIGSIKNVRECPDSTCPLWAFRIGGDPFYGKRGK